MFSHTWIPPRDRLLHAVVMPAVAGCSGRALSVLAHTRFSWTCWSCLADRVQLLMLSGKLMCSLQLALMVSQLCCLIPAHLLLEAWKGVSFFDEEWSRLMGSWQKKRRGERRPLLLFFLCHILKFISQVK